MPAPKGNNYWQFADKHGRGFKYTPKALWEEAIEYFKWLENSPLQEENLFAFQGHVTKENAAKMRAATLKGFFLFADINHTTFDNYRKNEDFIAITTRIENAIYTQKLEGASAGLLNPNIIAREIGLAEKRVVEKTVTEYTPEQRQARIDKLKDKLNG